MTDSPLFREAVEAMRLTGVNTNETCGCSDCDEARRTELEAALPFLRQMITEENAAKLESPDNHTHEDAEGVSAMRYAAAFLRGTR